MPTLSEIAELKVIQQTHMILYLKLTKKVLEFDTLYTGTCI